MTAVYFLYKQLESIRMDYNQRRISAEQAINSRAEVLESAKQMERQQKGYSEEEAYKIWKAGQEYWRTSGDSITFEELTEKFKNK